MKYATTRANRLCQNCSKMLFTHKGPEIFSNWAKANNLQTLDLIWTFFFKKVKLFPKKWKSCLKVFFRQSKEAWFQGCTQHAKKSRSMHPRPEKCNFINVYSDAYTKLLIQPNSSTKYFVNVLKKNRIKWLWWCHGAIIFCQSTKWVLISRNFFRTV